MPQCANNLDFADFLGTGMMVAVLKQRGMLFCDSNMLAHDFSTQTGVLSGPAALLIFTLCRILLTSAVDTGPLEAE